MYRCLHLILSCLLVGATPAVLFGQPTAKSLSPPSRKLIDEPSIDYLDFRALRYHLHNALEHYQYQNEANVNTTRTLRNQTDTLSQLRAQLQAQNTQLQQLKQVNRQYEKVGAGQKSLLDSVRRQTARLDYERQLIADTRVVRIYKFSVAEVRKTLIDNLTKNDSGFGYEGEPSADKLIITRQFNERSANWWAFDKNNDGLLEVTLRLIDHPFDSQRAIVYADTKLLQRNRSTDKLYEDQSDPERLTLYRERTLRLLEGYLRSTSEK